MLHTRLLGGHRHHPGAQRGPVPFQLVAAGPVPAVHAAEPPAEHSLEPGTQHPSLAERSIAELAAQEELDSIRPDLDGGQIMQILGIAPGPVVGEAYKFLLNVRLDEGSLPEEEAKARLVQWWEQRREA